VSFLEVNTRLQVEHPVSEETSGIDLVREQFRIADGEKLDRAEDPAPRGHSIEFRINGEDPGRGFLPAPGTIEKFEIPTGPGVRLDTGVGSGSVVSGNFDSLLAKLIVTGADRPQALQRARRALAELQITGMATALPFHRAVVADPAFTAVDGAFSVHTRWIETEFDNRIPPFEATGRPGSPDAADRTTVVAEVNGRRVEVRLPAGLFSAAVAAPNRAAGRTARPTRTAAVAAGSANQVTAPMQGTVVKVVATAGQTVAAGDVLLVIEAMKMENPVIAPRAGTVEAIPVAVGDAVTAGAVLAQLAAPD
jgi:acetyl-CoA/propionyl-CoA carboxylase biotin carboxyl carrier protein